MSNIEILGWTASALTSACSIPQVVKIIKDGHAGSLSFWFLVLWAGGNLLSQVYIYGTIGWNLALLSKYWFNDICLVIMFKYFLYPRKQLSPLLKEDIKGLPQ